MAGEKHGADKLPDSAPYGGLGLSSEETCEVSDHGAAKTNADIDI